MSEFLSYFFGVFLGSVVGLPAAAWLFSRLVGNLLQKDLEAFKTDQLLRMEEFKSAKTRELEEFKATSAREMARALEAVRAELAHDYRLIELKLPVYRELWEASGYFRPSQTDRVYSATEMSGSAAALRDWYFRAGRGALLGFRAKECLLAAIGLLAQASPRDSAAVRLAFSELRTQLMHDLRLYDDAEAARQIDHQGRIAELRRRAVEQSRVSA